MESQLSMTEKSDVENGDQPEEATVASGVAAGKRRVLRCVLFLAGPLLVAVLILLGFCVWSVWRYGNVTDGIALVNGYVLAAQKPIVELGKIPVGAKVDGIFVLKNLTDHPITILGARPECRCVVASDLPIQVDALSSVSFCLRFVPGENEANQHVTHRALLYLDADSPEIVLTLAADVIPAVKTPSGQAIGICSSLIGNSSISHTARNTELVLRCP
jgi:hypothetical protein